MLLLDGSIHLKVMLLDQITSTHTKSQIYFYNRDLLRFRDLEGREWFKYLARRVWFVVFPGQPPSWWRLEAELCPPHQQAAEHNAQRNP